MFRKLARVRTAIDIGLKHECHLHLYVEQLDYLKPKDIWCIISYLVLTRNKEGAISYEWLKFLGPVEK